MADTQVIKVTCESTSMQIVLGVLSNIDDNGIFKFEKDRFHITVVSSKKGVNASKPKKKKENRVQLTQAFCTFKAKKLTTYHYSLQEESHEIVVPLVDFCNQIKGKKYDALTFDVVVENNSSRIEFHTKTGGLGNLPCMKQNTTVKHVNYYSKYYNGELPTATPSSYTLSEVLKRAKGSKASKMVFTYNPDSGLVNLSTIGVSGNESNVEPLTSVEKGEDKGRIITRTIDLNKNGWLKTAYKLTSGVLQIYISEETIPIAIKTDIGNQGTVVFTVPFDRDDLKDD